MSDVQALFQRATDCLRRGQWAPAEAAFREILVFQPDHFDATQLLGVVLAQQEKFDQAAEALSAALRLRPADAAVLTNLGEVRRRQGNLIEAKAVLDQAVIVAPGAADAHFNRANVLKLLGDDEGAVDAYRRTLQLRPGHIKARFNLANTLREQGRTPAAIVEYETVRQASPQWFDARLNLGNALLDAGRAADAIGEYEAARSIDPSRIEIADCLGDAHARAGNISAAVDSYRQGLPRHRDRWLRELRIAALLDPIPRNAEEIIETRARLLEHVERLRGEALALDLGSLHQSGAEPPMGLAYHGMDDLPIRNAYGDLFARLIPSARRRKPTGKPHIGVVVTNGHEGVFGRCLAPLIDRLNREKLRITIVCSLAGRNILSHLFFKESREYLVLPSRVDEAAATLAEARFHVLHYWETGTDSTNYFLSFFQPSGIQSTTWGWPVTSGNPRISHFVSAQGLEPPGRASHYRERVIELASAPTYYERPPVPTPAPSRRALGLDENAHLYLCAQNLRKIQPDFDQSLAEILRADPQGVILLISDEQPGITNRLLDRLRQSAGDVGDRIRMLGRMERETYLAVLSAVDVNLDTFHYGGGANTVYDSVAAGTPIITWPGEFHRGRFSLATLSTLGIKETIAESREDYIHRAVAIASDADRRRSLSEMMLARREQVLEQVAAVRAYEEFFLEAAALAELEDTSP